MSPLPPVVLPAAELDNLYLIAQCPAFHLCQHLCPGNEGVAYPGIGFVPHRYYLRELNGVLFLQSLHKVYQEALSRGDLILFTPIPDDGVHGLPPYMDMG